MSRFDILVLPSYSHPYVAGPSLMRGWNPLTVIFTFFFRAHVDLGHVYVSMYLYHNRVISLLDTLNYHDNNT
jgi:hypothetical protein